MKKVIFKIFRIPDSPDKVICPPDQVFKKKKNGDDPQKMGTILDIKKR